MAKPADSSGILVSPATVRAELAGAENTAVLLAGVERILGRLGRRFSVETAEAIADVLAERAETGSSDDRAAMAAWVQARPEVEGPVALWVGARLLAITGNAEDAVRAWDACLATLPSLVAEGLLYRCRQRIRAEDWRAATADLRLALQQPCDYDFLNRAAKLLARLAEKDDSAPMRRARIAVLGGKASTALLAPLLRLACFRDSIAAMWHIGEYDQMRQEILNPSSGLYQFKPEIVIVPLTWRDATLSPYSDNAEQTADDAAQEILALCRTLHEHVPATVVLHSFDLPAHDPYGRLSGALPGGRASVLREINRLIAAAVADGRAGNVVLVDLEQVRADVGNEDWEDAKQWQIAKQHPGAAALPALVEHQVAAIRATRGLSKKVLVLDLDNVLWGGVIGEDGLARIQLGPPGPSGEAYQDFQRYVRALGQRGVLLAVVSKNNDADARLPFESHPETVLRLNDFIAFLANWDDKAANLRRLAEMLSLGLDSFVFVDDNPVERAWVRSQIPELLVVEMPDDPSRYVAALDRGRYFEAISLSAEDRARSETYRGNVAREELKTLAGTLESFLAELGMVAQHGPFDRANLSRIAQLVNKTNQFNLTTRRYTEAQLEVQSQAAGWWTQWFRLADRFGDNGLIGVLTCKPRAGEPDALEIDNWLMSCRVLGRGAEDAFLAQ
ncbi:MAG: HAD-IIIC family phosphatase, partial [Pirellulales bacterium]